MIPRKINFNYNLEKLVLLFVAIVAFCAFTDCQRENFSTEALSQTLLNKDSQKITFEEVLKKHKGKVTVIEVWASWCGDCVKAMPKIKSMQKEFSTVDYVFISMDKAADKWQEGIEKHELTGDHYWSTDGMKGAFGKAIDLDWIPRYIIIDSHGTIVTYRAIETDFEKMYETLKTIH
jgi:thiol-disulfide isomerase/thioredoxin